MNSTNNKKLYDYIDDRIDEKTPEILEKEFLEKELYDYIVGRIDEKTPEILETEIYGYIDGRIDEKVDIVNEWGDSPDKVLSQEFLSGYFGDDDGSFIIKDGDKTFTFPKNGEGGEIMLDTNLGYVTPEMFGAVGDGVTDDTSALQRCLDSFKDGHIIILTKKYLFDSSTPITINKENTFIVFSEDAILIEKKVGHKGNCVLINGNNIRINNLKVFNPGEGEDSTEFSSGIKISGNNIHIKNMKLLSSRICLGSRSSTRCGLHIDKSNMVVVEGLEDNHWDKTLIISESKDIKISSLKSKNYTRAVYIKDSENVRIENSETSITSPNSKGSSGENSILIESTLESNSSNNIIIDGFISRNSGEHGYRLGGQKTISNVIFRDCQSYDSGSSISVNNPEAKEWHGGCGFKVLGGTTVEGERHKNIKFINCSVYDVNDKTGSFPEGHGAGNFAGFQIAVAENVSLFNCIVDKIKQEYSCPRAVEILASDNIHFFNCVFNNSKVTGIRIFQVSTPEEKEYPGWYRGSSNISFNNCIISSNIQTVMVEEFDHIFSDIKFINCSFLSDNTPVFDLKVENSLIYVTGHIHSNNDDSYYVKNAHKMLGDIILKSTPINNFTLKKGSTRILLEEGSREISNGVIWKNVII